MPVTAFQPNAFQFDAFQIHIRVPHLTPVFVQSVIMIEVKSPMTRHEQGDAIGLRVQVEDGTQFPAIEFVPSGGVTISLYNPSGVIVLTTQAMTHLTNGLYQYVYQTSGSSPAGVWTAVFSSTNGGRTGVTLPVAVFILQ